MSRIPLVDPSAAEGKAKTLLDAVQKKMGLVPNITRGMANAPAVLEAYLSFSGAVAGSSLSAKLRERIALLVAEINSCNYCLSAHSAIGGQLGLKGDQVWDARRGQAEDQFDNAVLALARALVLERGQIADADLAAARAAGLDDAQILETLGTVLLNVFTNWFNHVADTPIDFPEVQAGQPSKAAS